MKKVLGMMALVVALLVPAQGVMAGEKEMKKMEETQQKLDKAMKMMKEKKMKMNPDQEKKLMKMLDDLSKELDVLLKATF
ncbi:MAG: hypothetical protein ACREJJ_05900 [Candidatus Methylomirabilales bacterium]